MLFRLFRLRKSAIEAKKDTGGFVSNEVGDALLGILIIPVVMVALALIGFFLLGFTGFLGGPFWLFKILFIVGVVVSLSVIAVLRPILRLIKHGTKRMVDRGVQGIKEIPNEIK